MRILIWLGFSLFASASFGQTPATFAPLECYKAAAADPQVFSQLKKFDRSGLSAYAEENMVSLCAAVLAAEMRIPCFKSAMSDPKILVSYKRFDSPGLSAYAEVMAGRLCGTGTSCPER